MNITGETRVLGIIGNPVRHTMSPMIHNTISERTGRNMVYLPFEVEEGITEAVKGAYALGIAGMNVTVPYKEQVIEALCEVEELAASIGAVNTLVRTPKGFKGYNTDILGLMRELKEEDIDVKGRDCVLLGAGGAARAAAFLCAKLEAGSITIANRTVEKAERILEDVKEYVSKEHRTDMKLSAVELSKAAELDVQDCLVIQCTKVGLYPKTEEVVVEDTAFYTKVAYGVDLIYKPFETKFMQLVKEHGGVAYNGLKMLLYQGIEAYELWNETKISDEIIAELYKLLKECP